MIEVIVSNCVCVEGFILIQKNVGGVTLQCHRSLSQKNYSICSQLHTLHEGKKERKKS